MGNRRRTGRRRRTLRARRPTTHHSCRPTTERPRVLLLLRNGWALVVRTIALGAALTTATAVAAQVGSATLAAHQIVLQIWLLLALVTRRTRRSCAGLRQRRSRCERRRRGRAHRRSVSAPRSCRQRRRRRRDDGALPRAAATCSRATRLFGSIATIGLIVCGALQPFAALAFVYDGLLLGASDYTTLRRVNAPCAARIRTTCRGHARLSPARHHRHLARAHVLGRGEIGTAGPALVRRVVGR